MGEIRMGIVSRDILKSAPSVKAVRSVLLGSVYLQDGTVAPIEKALEGTDDKLRMTPFTTRAVIEDVIGSAGKQSAEDFATAEQGQLAENAVQKSEVGTAAQRDVADFATATQGELAETAVQPEHIGTAAKQPVEAFATAIQGAKAETAVQPEAFEPIRQEFNGVAEAAQTSAAKAEFAAEAAALTGALYNTQALGEAATPVGKVFQSISATVQGAIEVRLRTAAGSDLRKTVPSSERVTSLEQNFAPTATDTEIALDVRNAADASFLQLLKDGTLLAKIAGVRPRTPVPLTSGTGMMRTLSAFSAKSCANVQYHRVGIRSGAAIRLCYSNRLIRAGEVATTNAVTVKSSLDVGGKIIPVFFKGQRSVTLLPGEEIYSDAIPLRLVQVSGFFSRTLVSVETADMQWPTGNGTSLTVGEGIYFGVTDIDGAQSSWGTASTGAQFAPTVIVGVPDRFVNTFGLVGDSLLWGQGDTGEAPTWEVGPVNRALAAAGLGFTSLAHPGDTITNMQANWRFRREHLLASGVSHVITNMIVNDIFLGLSPGDLKLLLTWLWDALDGIGLPIIQTTLPPLVSSSTDGFTTLEGQVLNSAINSRRRALNEFIRSRPHPAIIEVWDWASFVEEGTTEKWRVDGGPWTTDGVHWTPLSARAAAKGLAPLASAYVM